MKTSENKGFLTFWGIEKLNNGINELVKIFVQDLLKSFGHKKINCKSRSKHSSSKYKSHTLKFHPLVVFLALIFAFM